jgi:aspartate racemase
MHIGLIGGIGAAATEFYYRGLVARHAGIVEPMELTIVHADARDLAKNNTNGDVDTQARIFLKFIARLQAGGAKAAAITSIGGHFCVDEVMAQSPIPILNAIPEIAKRLGDLGLKRVGLLGTARVMRTKLYGGIPSVAVVVPEGDLLDRIHHNYITMAVSGKVTDEQRHELFVVGKSLCRDQGADVVLLAGTDLFLAFDGYDCGFQTLDCADIHMDALHLALLQNP